MNAFASNTFLLADRIPLGIPPVLIADKIARDLSVSEQLSASLGLVREYAGAKGYVYDWGQVVERRISNYVLWLFVPVELWLDMEPQRLRCGFSIPDLIDFVQDGVRDSLEPILPAGVVVTGVQRSGRRHPHALFGLLTDRDGKRQARRWIARRMIPESLPKILSRAGAILNSIPKAGQ